MCIKQVNSGDNDWFYCRLDALAVDAEGDSMLYDALPASLAGGKELRMDYDIWQRDGLIEGDEVSFLVLHRRDVLQLIGSLARALQARA